MHSRNQILLILKWFLVTLSFTCTEANPTSDLYSSSYPAESDYLLDTGEDYVYEEANDPNMYQCPGEPIILEVAQLCDGHPDCSDGSDENRVECKDNGQEKIEKAAPAYVKPPVVMKTETDLDKEYNDYEGCDNLSFECPSAKGLCIPLSSQCDGLADCPDGEDELSCDVTTTIRNRPIPPHNGVDNWDDYTGIRMYSPTASSTPPSTSTHHGDSGIMIEDSDGKVEIIHPVGNTERPIARSNLVTQSFIPKLLAHVQRSQIQKVKIYKDERRTAGFHQSIRHSSESENGRDTPILPYIGETGETFVTESTQRRLETMSDLEAEKFLQSYASQTANGNSKEELNLSSTKQQHSSLAPATEQTAATTTSTLSSTTTQSKKAKRKKSHKKKVKGLLYKLMRQMGNLVTSEANDFDMDVNIRLREIPKQETNSNDLTDSRDSTRPKQRRKPKINLHLDMSL